MTADEAAYVRANDRPSLLPPLARENAARLGSRPGAVETAYLAHALHLVPADGYGRQGYRRGDLVFGREAAIPDQKPRPLRRASTVQRAV